jgi:hypothetical protein
VDVSDPRGVAGGFGPHASREEAERELARHPMYCDLDGRHYVAWNVKVREPDLSGRHPDVPVDSALDARWQSLVERDDGVFWEACVAALSRYLRGEAPGTEGCRIEIRGKSGGHLCLVSWDGPPAGPAGELGFGSAAELEAFLGGLPDRELGRLAAAVAAVDEGTRSPAAAVAAEAARIRAAYEAAWKSP